MAGQVLEGGGTNCQIRSQFCSHNEISANSVTSDVGSQMWTIQIELETIVCDFVQMM